MHLAWHLKIENANMDLMKFLNPVILSDKNILEKKPAQEKS